MLNVSTCCLDALLNNLQTNTIWLSDARLLIKGVPAEKSVTPLQHLKVQSLVLFAHAAMEEYLESLGWGVALAARQMLKDEGAISYVLVALIASKVIGDIPEKAKKKVTQDLVSNMDTFSDEAVTMYRKMIGNNHGVTEGDQKSVLLPIGIDPESFDLALMNDLHAFGGRRGNIEHRFSLIRNELTLGDVNQKIDAITIGLRKIDRAACAGLSRRMLPA